MKEIKSIEVEKELPKEIIKVEERPEKSMKDMVGEIHTALENAKTKKIKLPRKARAKKRKLKKGWVGALIIDENRNIHGEKIKIEGSCFNEKAGTYHATTGEELFWFEGKLPILIQPTWRINPINVKKDIGEKNETYGHRYIKAKMLADVIKVKAKGGSIIIWLLIGAAVLFGINYFMGA